MTIKQQGGVFGRNPVFNEAEAKDLTVTNSMNVDNGTLQVDPVNNRVGVKIAPATDLHVYNAAGAMMRVEAAAAPAYLNLKNSTRSWNIYTDNVTGKLSFFDVTFGVERMGLSTDGNLSFLNGRGIDFSATSGTGTSELFDDYEEGTWTATVGCTGNATTTTTVTAYYTKVGRQVTVGFRLLNNIDTTGLAGFFQIGGLPYACISGSTAGFAGIADWSDLTYPASVDTVTPVISNGGSAIVFSARGSGITGGLLGATQPTSGVTDIAHLALTYFTA